MTRQQRRSEIESGASKAPEHPLFQPDDAWLKSFRRKLRAWFKRRQRDLPWRRTKDLYAIWVSEIMLQQTQVATVVPYFERFLQRFPDVGALAAAEESEVLRHWEGLGYYRRARQLHAAAQQIVDLHEGVFPDGFDDVHALPGVGRYTAGAILSIGADQRCPIVEANTIRLYSRLLLMVEDPRKARQQRQLWAFAERLLPARSGSGELNQALMELGATVCTPKNPQCDSCPIVELCPAFRRGMQTDIPQVSKRMTYEDVVEAAVVFVRGGDVLLRQCQAGERWAGLWDFIRFPCSGQPTDKGDKQLQKEVSEVCGAASRSLAPLTTLKHGVTRFRITLHVFVGRVDAEWDMEDLKPWKPFGANTVDAEPVLKWTPIATLDSIALSATGRTICEHMKRCGMTHGEEA